MKTVIAGVKGMVRLIIFVLLLGVVSGCAGSGTTSDGELLTDDLAAPLDGAAAAKVDIDTGIGHLTIDRLNGEEQMLANGSLQYLENQSLPTRSVSSDNGQATLTLRAGATTQPRFQLPWAACAGGTYEWLIHLNPKVATDITAHSAGGNVRLNLAGMAVTRLAADTNGGNMEVILPDNTADLSAAAETGAGDVTVEVGNGITGSNSVTASSGAGNVEVRVPGGVAVRVHATSGVGKVMVDSRFDKLDDSTYQTADYEGAANRVEITASSGAGNVSINTR